MFPLGNKAEILATGFFSRLQKSVRVHQREPQVELEQRASGQFQRQLQNSPVTARTSFAEHISLKSISRDKSMTENRDVLSDNVSRVLGRDAQHNNILAAKIIADIIKTTLGPKGMDKMLVSTDGEITVTNDGATILREIEIEHPAARMMVEIAKTQEREVGDGTTTAVILAGKLLEQAEILINKKVHPTTIVKGYKIASDKSIEYLTSISKPLEKKETLIKIATTAMTGKVAESDKEHLARLIVEAIDKTFDGKKADAENVKLESIAGSHVSSSELIDGIVLNKEKINSEMPSMVTGAKILLIDFPLEIKNPEMQTKISVSTPEQLESFISSEENYIRELSQKLISSGANVIFCQKGIDDLVQYYLTKSQILAFRRIPKSDMEKISRATSARIISNIEEISSTNFGSAKIVEEIKSEEETLTYIGGCQNPKVVTLIIRGGTEHVAVEIQRAVIDGIGDVIAALSSERILPGGGATEISLAKRLRQFSKTLSGREQLAIEEFANALESIPQILAENAGLDPINTLAELRRKHEEGKTSFGLNLFTNSIEDAFQAGIIEPLKLKTVAISTATEVASLILRVDDVLISKRKSESPEKEVLD